MFVGNNLQWMPHQQISAASTTQRIAFVLAESCDLLGLGAIAEALECACVRWRRASLRKGTRCDF
jgi:hypothetical protein